MSHLQHHEHILSGLLQAGDLELPYYSVEGIIVNKRWAANIQYRVPDAYLEMVESTQPNPGYDVSNLGTRMRGAASAITQQFGATGSTLGTTTTEGPKANGPEVNPSINAELQMR